MTTFLFNTLASAQQKVMSDSSSQSFPGASGSPQATEANIFGAFGAVLGYIGAEAATTPVFERLVWPQRSYANFQLSSVLGVMALTPLGGPMYKAALKTLDKFFEHGLFEGPHQGHMLGTAFFPEQGWQYTMHGDGEKHETHTEPLRNCIWVRALACLPMLPINNISSRPQSPERVEDGTSKEKPLLRARVAVSDLEITLATPKDKKSSLPFVSEDTQTPGFRVFLAICTSELTAIILAAIVAGAFKSSWALLWVIPLFLRIFSAYFALEREPLVSAGSASSTDDPACNFEIHCPQSDGNFMLFRGPPTLVLQFMRHYGHPKRNRPREVMQLFSVVSFISIFPIGLLCSTLWMPSRLQYMWLSYQLYVVFAMYISRFSRVGRMASTEYKIADAFVKQGSAMGSTEKRGSSILFGHDRFGSETLRVNLTVTYHSRNAEGRDAMRNLLR